MRHSLYIHIPFCTHRCAYCDFNTYAGLEGLIPAYVEALCRELKLVGRQAPADCSVHTVFLGGGTPSLLSGKQVNRILNVIRGEFQLERGAEVTLEANPGTVAVRELTRMRGAGVNRISLGVQSANAEELRMLERTHNFGDVLHAVSDARRAGFTDLNLDLIYGLPEQALTTWKTTLERVLELHPEHISSYCLTLEHGTPFGRWAQRGLMPIPDPDKAADMYEAADEVLTAAGYEQYEISNWALAGHQCRHNLQYWKGQPYLGFGAGAHGYASGHRYSNVLAIREYISRMLDSPTVRDPSGAEVESVRAGSAVGTHTYPCSPAVVERHQQSRADEMAEFMIMGLRLTREGIGEGQFRGRFGRSMDETYGPQLARLTRSGLIETVGGRSPHAGPDPSEATDSSDARIRLTKRGRLLGNRVFSEFVN